MQYRLKKTENANPGAVTVQDKVKLIEKQIKLRQLEKERRRRSQQGHQEFVSQVIDDKARRQATITAYPFKQFIVDTFPVIEQGREFQDNWHIDIISELLQAVILGEVRNFLINQPRRTMKSLLTCVMFPCWVWTFLPHLQFLYTSYSAAFAGRDNEKCYELIQSAYYQQKWGNTFEFTTAQLKKSLKNSRGGFRQVFKIGKGTGNGGDFVIADDPNSIDEIESDLILKKTNLGWNEVSYHNVANRNTAVRGIVQQRTGVEDLTGNILEDSQLRELYQVLCLPMKYESDHPNRNSAEKPLRLGKVSIFDKTTNPNLIVGEDKLWIDPRDLDAPNFQNVWYQEWYRINFREKGLESKGDGQLLWESYLPLEVVESDIAHLKVHGESSQYQQRPTPRGGQFFNSELFKIVEPSTIDMNNMRLMRYWDKAGCFPANTLITTNNGKIPIQDVKIGDLVLTRKGYKKVQWSGISKYVDRLTVAKFDNGIELKATADHRIWTNNRGWVRLDSLRSYDNIVSENQYLGENECQLSEQKAQKDLLTPKLLTLTELLIHADPEKDILKQCDGIKLQKNIIPTRCIVPFGDFTTEKYQKATTFITKTMIGTITTSQILSALLKVNIIKNIQINGKLQNTDNCLTVCDQKPQKHQKNGGNHDHLILTNANCAEQNFKAEAWTLNEFAFANQNAPTKLDTKRRIPVYDLTVEDEHEFFANGILVHNSDGKGDWTVGTLMARTKTRPFQFHIVDMHRVQLSYFDRMAEMKKIAKQDMENYVLSKTNCDYTIGIEREGGSSGKDVSLIEKEELIGYDVWIDYKKVSKETRAKIVKQRSEGGYIKVFNNHVWNKIFLKRLEKYDPKKANQKDDEIDTIGGCLYYLAFMLIQQYGSSDSYS